MTLHRTGLTIDLCYFLHAFYIVIISGVTCPEPGVVTSYITSVIYIIVSGVTCLDPGVVTSYTTSVIYLLVLLCEVLILVS